MVIITAKTVGTLVTSVRKSDGGVLTTAIFCRETRLPSLDKEGKQLPTAAARRFEPLAKASSRISADHTTPVAPRDRKQSPLGRGKGRQALGWVAV